MPLSPSKIISSWYTHHAVTTLVRDTKNAEPHSLFLIGILRTGALRTPSVPLNACPVKCLPCVTRSYYTGSKHISPVWTYLTGTSLVSSSKAAERVVNIQ